MNDVYSFHISINNIEEMINYFKDKNHISKNNLKKYKMLTTIKKSFDTIVIIATKSSSFTLSFPGIGLIVISISTGIAFGLTISYKVVYGLVMQKYNQDKKRHEKDQQTIKYIDKV